MKGVRVGFVACVPRRIATQRCRIAVPA